MALDALGPMQCQRQGGVGEPLGSQPTIPVDVEVDALEELLGRYENYRDAIEELR